MFTALDSFWPLNFIKKICTVLRGRRFLRWRGVKSCVDLSRELASHNRRKYIETKCCQSWLQIWNVKLNGDVQNHWFHYFLSSTCTKCVMTFVSNHTIVTLWRGRKNLGKHYGNKSANLSQNAQKKEMWGFQMSMVIGTNTQSSGIGKWMSLSYSYSIYKKTKTK